MALNLIVLGPPGAGKGTQAERFARSRGIPKVSTGDILREAVQKGTPIGFRAKAIMDRGELVSDEVMIGIVRERLDRPDAAGGFVLDGFPRTVSQAIALEGLMAGRDSLIVVDIAVPDAELVRRLQLRMICQQCGANAVASAEQASTPDARCQRCGGRLVHRSDDDINVVRQRLSVYARDTKPLLDYYQDRPTFRSVDGAQSPDGVAAALAAAIDAASVVASGGGQR